MNFHEFLNLLKELMIVINRGLTLSFPIVDLIELMMIVKKVPLGS
jgi:hypothetical protein